MTIEAEMVSAMKRNFGLVKILELVEVNCLEGMVLCDVNE